MTRRSVRVFLTSNPIRDSGFAIRDVTNIRRLFRESRIAHRESAARHV